MAVITFLRNPYLALPVREPLDDLAHDLASESAAVSAVSAAESANTHTLPATRRVSPILQRLEAGQ